jgi:hypothetical protein
MGIILIMIQFIGSNMLLYCFIGVLIFEGITNWRIPLLISRIRSGRVPRVREEGTRESASIPFDAERAFRLIIAALLIVSIFVFPDALWFIPWFIGFGVGMAGVTGVCPMAMALKKAGFRS